MKTPAAKVLLCLLFGLCVFPVFSQNVYISGRDWSRLRGEWVDVVFPRELEEEAQRGANLLDKILPELASDLGVKNPRRWTLVLNFDNLNFNGYVTLAPRYSLWYQANGETRILQGDWMSLLASHEGRHMAQFDRLNQGVGKFLYFLFGDMGQAYLSSLVLSPWLMEGDAVLTETLATPFGRGRDPEFFRQMKALALGDGSSSGGAGTPRNFGYYQVLNDSYRYELPNWYEYGYFLVTHIRKTYGTGALERIYRRALEWPIPALGMYMAAKEVTGQSLPRLFEEMMGGLREYWADESGFAPGPAVSYPDFPQKKEVFHYSRPGRLGEGSWGILRSSRDDQNRLLIFSNDDELSASLPINALTGGVFDLAEGLAVYGLLAQHPRWQAIRYGDLELLDLATGKKRRLTRGERYCSAALEPGGRYLAAVGMDSAGGQRIDLFDVAAMEKIKTFSVPPGSLPGGLSWDTPGRELVMTLITAEGRALVLLNTETGSWDFLMPPGQETIKDPVIWNDWILFSSGYTGTAAIHAIHRQSRELFLVYSSLLGAFKPRPIENSLIFVEFAGTRGEKAGRIPLEPETWISREALGESPAGFFLPLIEEDALFREAGLPGAGLPLFDPSLIPERVYPVESWRPGRGLFRVHSWGLGLAYPELQLGLESQDILGTLGFRAAGFWNLIEARPGAGFSFSFRRFSPVITGSAAYRRRNKSGRDWDELSLAGGVSLPLDFSQNRGTRQLELSARAEYVFAFLEKTSFENGPFLYAGVSYTGGLAGGERQIGYRWGAAFQASGGINPLKTEEHSIYGSLVGFTPGFYKNHSLKVEVAGEWLKGNRTSSLWPARGYSGLEGDLSLRGSLDYDFPLGYPDLPIFGLAFIKRLRGKIFGDYFWQDKNVYPSAGLGLITDFTIFSISQAEFSAGLLLSYRLRDGRFSLSLLFLDLAL